MHRTENMTPEIANAPRKNKSKDYLEATQILTQAQDTPESWNGDLQLPPIRGGKDFGTEPIIEAALKYHLIRRAIKSGETLFCEDYHGNVSDHIGLARALVTDFGKTKTILISSDYRFLIMHQDAVIELELLAGSANMYVVTVGNKIQAYRALGDKYLSLRSPDNCTIQALVNTIHGPTLKPIGHIRSDLDYPNYTDEVGRDIQHVIDDLRSPNPCGRVTILDGPPGTGKTYAVRGILSAIRNNAEVVIIPPEMITEICKPGALLAFLDPAQNAPNTPTLLILEDANSALAPRAGDNLSDIAAILNLGDGILGEILNIRIICTTNIPTKQIDKALVRVGRLCRHIHIGELPPDKANAVYQRLTGSSDQPFTKPEILAHAYRAAREHGWTPPTGASNPRVGFSTKP